MSTYNEYILECEKCRKEMVVLTIGEIINTGRCPTCHYKLKLKKVEKKEGKIK